MKARTGKEVTNQGALTLKTALSREEAVELEILEAQIESNLEEFQNAAFQIGSALSIINRKKLYRATHKTFEAYVSQRFDLSRPHAYSVMTAAKTYEALTDGRAFDTKDLPSLATAERIYRGVERLLKQANMPAGIDRDRITKETARNVYDIASSKAPKDKNGQPVFPPAFIKGIFSFLHDALTNDPTDFVSGSVIARLSEPSSELWELLKEDIERGFQRRQLSPLSDTSHIVSSEHDAGIQNWRIAELHVKEYLSRLAGATLIEDVSERNLGHDLEVTFRDGRKIYVEVKAVTSFSEAFKLTNNEFSSASLYGEAYYVAIVLNGKKPQIKFLSDPLSKLPYEKVIERFSLKFKKYTDHLEDRL